MKIFIYITDCTYFIWWPADPDLKHALGTFFMFAAMQCYGGTSRSLVSWQWTHPCHITQSLPSLTTHHKSITTPLCHQRPTTTRSNVPTTHSGLQRGNPPLSKQKRSNADKSVKCTKSEKNDDEGVEKKRKGGREEAILFSPPHSPVGVRRTGPDSTGLHRTDQTLPNLC